MGSPRIAPQARALAAVGLVLSLAAPAAADFDGRIPIAPCRMLDRFNGPYPPHAGALKEVTGAECVVYWDDLLGTPRYVSMRSAYRFVEGPVVYEEALTEQVVRFIEGNRDFFGAGPENLSAPDIRKVGGSWKYVFREFVGEAAVRGANLRILVAPDGTLESIKAFLLRDPPAPVDEFIPFDAVQTYLDDWNVQLTFREPQLYFRRYDPASIAPVWYVRGMDAEGDGWEWFFDSITGEPLEKRKIGAGFGEFDLVVMGNYPNPQRLHVGPTGLTYVQSDEIKPYFIMGAKVEEQFGPITDYGITDEAGTVEMPVSGLPGDSVSLRASLEYARCGTDIPSSTRSICAPDQSQVLMSLYLNGGDHCRYESGRIPNLTIQGPVGSGGVLTFNPLGASKPDYTQSFMLMAFHHVQTMLDEAINRMNVNGIVPSKSFYPLKVVVPGDLLSLDAESYHSMYLGQEKGSMICLTKTLSKNQPTTPTIILHETAHHILYILTFALNGRTFDCMNVFTSSVCIEQGGDLVREEMILEGLTDALAAYKSGSPLFGYVETPDENTGDVNFIPGDMAYDISDPNYKSDPDQADVGSALWRMYKNFDKGIEEDIVNNLLYTWIAINGAPESIDRHFDASESFQDEILDQLEKFISKENERRKEYYRRKVIRAFAGTRFFHAPFVRGDADQNRKIELTDAIYILQYMFLGRVEDRCMAAMDVDFDGEINISDPIYLLSSTFLGGPPPPEPYSSCGLDPAPPESRLPCREFSCEW